jgi:hypothetical protein
MGLKISYQLKGSSLLEPGFLWGFWHVSLSESCRLRGILGASSR